MSSIEWAREEFEGMITWDGFDEAFIGVVHRCGTDAVACYDAEKMREVLVERDKMTYEEACEYLDYNVFGAYVGENTPFHLEKGLDI